MALSLKIDIHHATKSRNTTKLQNWRLKIKPGAVQYSALDMHTLICAFFFPKTATDGIYSTSWQSPHSNHLGQQDVQFWTNETTQEN